MPAEQTRRGRPKGSGLDDTEKLRKVARMLEADPDLKPTTAIKAIGISDPSTIRRLRDKLRDSEAHKDEATRSAASGAKRLGGAITAAQRLVSTLSPRRDISRQTSEGMACENVPAAAREAARENAAVTWFAAWCGFGLHALSTTVEAQLAVFESLLGVPEIASAMKHQVLLSEQVMAFCSCGTDVRTTLH